MIDARSNDPPRNALPCLGPAALGSALAPVLPPLRGVRTATARRGDCHGQFWTLWPSLGATARRAAVERTAARSRVGRAALPLQRVTCGRPAICPVHPIQSYPSQVNSCPRASQLIAVSPPRRIAYFECVAGAPVEAAALRVQRARFTARAAQRSSERAPKRKSAGASFDIDVGGYLGFGARVPRSCGGGDRTACATTPHRKGWCGRGRWRAWRAGARRAAHVPYRMGAERGARSWK